MKIRNILLPALVVLASTFLNSSAFAQNDIADAMQTLREDLSTCRLCESAPADRCRKISTAAATWLRATLSGSTA